MFINWTIVSKGSDYISLNEIYRDLLAKDQIDIFVRFFKTLITENSQITIVGKKGLVLFAKTEYEFQSSFFGIMYKEHTTFIKKQNTI